MFKRLLTQSIEDIFPQIRLSLIELIYSKSEKPKFLGRTESPKSQNINARTSSWPKKCCLQTDLVRPT